MPVPVLDIHEVLAEAMPALPIGDADAARDLARSLSSGQGPGAGEDGAVRAGVHSRDRARRDSASRNVLRVRRRHAHEPSPSFRCDRRCQGQRTLSIRQRRVVVTGCPGCRMQMADALKRAGSDAVVLHTVQLIAMRISDCGLQNELTGTGIQGTGYRVQGP